jgi:cytoskeleton protein RodZ
VSAATQQFGEELKRNRELKEVSREQLAAATKVSLRQIEALEMGRFDLLPALVFSRGFVRAIAALVGLDGEALVAEFTRLHRDWSAEQAESALPLTLSHSGMVPRLSRPRRAVSTDTTVRGLAIAAALALATAGAAILKSRSSAPPSASTSPAPARERADAGPASLGIPPAIAKATVPLPPEAPRAEAGAPAPVDARSPASSPALAGGVTLTLSFEEDCWTELYADGKKLAVETFPKGTTREFSGFQKYTLTLGNAGGVRITVNGHPVQPLGPPGHVVRNVVIDERRNGTDG